jgi:hypothetical protein
MQNKKKGGYGLRPEVSVGYDKKHRAELVKKIGVAEMGLNAEVNFRAGFNTIDSSFLHAVTSSILSGIKNERGRGEERGLDPFSLLWEADECRYGDRRRKESGKKGRVQEWKHSKMKSKACVAVGILVVISFRSVYILLIYCGHMLCLSYFALIIFALCDEDKE